MHLEKWMLPETSPKLHMIWTQELLKIILEAFEILHIFSTLTLLKAVGLPRCLPSFLSGPVTVTTTSPTLSPITVSNSESPRHLPGLYCS